MIDREVEIPAVDLVLEGRLTIPDGAAGLVMFAHGSGSGRWSPRNQFVARELRSGRLGTLLFDLLTEEEEAFDAHTGHLRFDIPLLAERLLFATVWTVADPSTRELHLGYFGSSTGAAAALVAAVQMPQIIGAVVSRGGRPDLAGPMLEHCVAPTMLIVGGDDEAVVELNRVAMQRMHCERQLEIIAGATHLFEEAGALERVAELARGWFERYLVERPAVPARDSHPLSS